MTKRLVVFDLDYTLWPFWVDTHVTPPFSRDSNGTIRDRCGDEVKCYPDVPQILELLKNDGYIIAAASRTGEIRGAEQLVDLFGWNKYFTYKQIYPGQKTTHFKYFQEQSGIPYSEMFFFDDEYRNIQDVSKLGQICRYGKAGKAEKAQAQK